MRRAFMQRLTELAKKDSKIVLLYGDVKQEMNEFERLFPERIFNMGNAEQSMVGIAAGMASNGLRPVVYTITPFLIKRALEQISLDIDQQKVPVILVGYDSCYAIQGPTHNGIDSKEICKIFKNIDCYFPSSLEETIKMLNQAHGKNTPAFFSLKRYNQ